MYLHKQTEWPNFRWDEPRIIAQLTVIRHLQGRLVGKMEALGFRFRREAILQTLIEDVVKTSEIEGEILDKDHVRSSVAKRLGIDVGGIHKSDRQVEGVVEMMLDATQNYGAVLTQDRLFSWHKALFPTGQSGMNKIKVGDWRDDSEGLMRVVSGAVGKEIIHYIAPEAARLKVEMTTFLKWLNSSPEIDLVLQAAIAHLWFVTVHPFDDGNGRIARAIADLILARSEGSSDRFYSMSAQIRVERNDYYLILENTQKGSLDITAWLEWFLNCLYRAFQKTEVTLEKVLLKAKFWERHSQQALNERQRKILNFLLDDFIGKLTSSKWAKLAKCSQDTAHRDIVDLVQKSILVQDKGGGRSTSYSLIESKNLTNST